MAYGPPPDWMVLEAITKLSRKHDNRPSQIVIQSYLHKKYGEWYGYSNLVDKLESMGRGCILMRFPGNYYKSPQWGIHPDYYPEPPLKDPYTEEERRKLREILTKREEIRKLREEDRKEYKRRKAREYYRLKKRAKLRPSFMEVTNDWLKITDRVLESTDIMEMIEEDPGSVIILDTETTGLNFYHDDVLELSIINGAGITLLSERYNSWFDSWDEAQEIHGIRPEDVRGLPYIEERTGEISRILRNAKAIVGYNIQFDRIFLMHAGVKWPNVPTCDVMTDFAYVYGEWADWINEGEGDYKWQKLGTAGRYYGIDVSGAHGSLADCRITLEVLKKIAKEPEEKRHRGIRYCWPKE